MNISYSDPIEPTAFERMESLRNSPPPKRTTTPAATAVPPSGCLPPRTMLEFQHEEGYKKTDARRRCGLDGRVRQQPVARLSCIFVAMGASLRPERRRRRCLSGHSGRRHGAGAPHGVCLLVGHVASNAAEQGGSQRPFALRSCENRRLDGSFGAGQRFYSKPVLSPPRTVSIGLHTPSHLTPFFLLLACPG